MKVLIYGVSNTYGGIETFFINLIKKIPHDEFQFDFITSSAETCSYDQEIRAAKGNNYSIVPWGKNPKDHIQEVKKVLQENQYAYIWINTASASKFSVYKEIKSASSATLILHSHGSTFESKRKGLKRVLLKLMHTVNKNKLAKLADIKFATSREAAIWLFGTEWSNDNCYFIKNGINSKKFLFNGEVRKKIRREFKLDNSFVLGHVGRLTGVKNQTYLLDVLKAIQNERPESKLMIIGSGPLEAQLKEKTEELGLSSDVLFLGYKEDAAPYLSAMDVFLLPSISEGLPISAVEAQAADLPCFLSDGITKETTIIEDVNYLSIHVNPQEWADEILSISPSRKRINRADIFKEKRFNIEDTVESIKYILQKHKNL